MSIIKLGRPPPSMLSLTVRCIATGTDIERSTRV